MKIIIDRFKEEVDGIDRPALQPEISITVPDDFNFTKVITEADGEKQKTNENGEYLYKTNIRKNEMDEDIWDEVTTPEQDGVQLEPVMVPNEVQKTISFKDQPFKFMLDEVIQEKFRQVLEASTSKNLVADAFLEESDLDLTDPGHKANTGVGICQLLPNGQAKTKPITLSAPATVFKILEFEADEGIEIYLNDQAFTNGQLQLQAAATECTIKFKNPTDAPKSARAYAIGY